MSDPARHPLSIADLPALLAEVPALVREVRELRAEVEAMRGRELRCSCGSTEFTTETTRRTPQGVKRWKRCRACGGLLTTLERLG